MDFVRNYYDLSSFPGDFDREIDRFFDHVQRRKRQPVQFTSQTWRPLMDVFETDDMVVALVELAGVDEGQLEVTVEDRTLAIRGSRGQTSEHQPHSYYVMEINHGPFERVLQLPAQVDPRGTRAATRNGLLEICMPKIKAQQITITIIQEGNGGR